MTAADIAQLTGRIFGLNEQHRQVRRALERLTARVEKIVLDDEALREDLDKLYLATERAR